MRSKTLTALAAATFATMASTAFAAEPVPTNQFKSLGKIVAVPMSKADLSSVRGEHVHFLDGSGGFHLAGNPYEINWIPGGTDGVDVAPSYRGLCVARGVGEGGIAIPGYQVQC